jgi:hypothetical protein
VRNSNFEAVNAHVTALQREVTDANDKLRTEMDDVLKDRLNSLKADRDRTKAALERAKSLSSQAVQIDSALLDVLERAVLAGRNGAPGSQMSTRWRSLGKSGNPTKSIR